MTKSTYLNLDIPFHTQLNNDSDHDSGWWNECSYTAMAMFLRKHGYVGNGNGQFEDQIEKSFEAWGGGRGEPQAMSAFMNQFFPHPQIEYKFTYRATWGFLEERLKANSPAILHTWLTGSGHVVLLKGFDDKAYNGTGGYIFHDPFGEWFPSGYDTNLSGANVTYSYPLCKRLIGVDGDLWAHYAVLKQNA